MIAIAMAYLAIGLALGCAWAATEMRLEPQRGFFREILSVSLVGPVIIAAMVWPFVMVFAIALMLIKKPKKHDE
jgi:ABC-type Fe3+ transport system permease subunit